LDFDDACSQVAATLRARLESEGCPIGAYDTLIAATALRHGAALVTRNVAEFSRVQGLELIDWHA
jgi:tRNA(fMet)-specific endonuclease VapC